MDNMTAKVSCFARAYHYKNNDIHIFADDMAAVLLGDDYKKIAESMSQGISFFLPDFHGSKEEGLRMIVDRQLSPSVLGRSAFCEEMLHKAMGEGCVQYLIFAAGYDWHGRKFCVSDIRQRQEWRCGNRAESGELPLGDPTPGSAPRYARHRRECRGVLPGTLSPGEFVSH